MPNIVDKAIIINSLFFRANLFDRETIIPITNYASEVIKSMPYRETSDDTYSLCATKKYLRLNVLEFIDDNVSLLIKKNIKRVAIQILINKCFFQTYARQMPVRNI